MLGNAISGRWLRIPVEGRHLRNSDYPTYLLILHYEYHFTQESVAFRIMVSDHGFDGCFKWYTVDIVMGWKWAWRICIVICSNLLTASNYPIFQHVWCHHSSMIWITPLDLQHEITKVSSTFRYWYVAPVQCSSKHANMHRMFHTPSNDFPISHLDDKIVYNHRDFTLSGFAPYACAD